MGFETKWAGAAISPTRDRRAPKSHRHESWIERLLSSAFRTVVEGFALYGATYAGALYPGPFLPADDQPRFTGFGEVRRDGSRAAWEDIDNQTLKEIGFPDDTEHVERRSWLLPLGFGVQGLNDGDGSLRPLPAPGGEHGRKADSPLEQAGFKPSRSRTPSEAARMAMLTSRQRSKASGRLVIEPFPCSASR